MRPVHTALSLLLVFSLFHSVRAADADPVKERLDKSRRHHEFVDIKVGKDRKLRTFIVYPEVSKPAPVVVVIHENKGLTDWVRSVADHLAELGYVAVAPDFLSGTGPKGGGTDSYESVDAATKGIYALNQDQVTKDLDAAVDYARDNNASNKTVAVAGFCWGGGQSFQYATHNPTIAAAFVFYGVTPKPADLAKIKAPVYGFYGGSDFRISGAVPKTQQAMKAAGKKYEPEIYKEAGHGFMRAGEGPDAKPADKEAHKQAWKRWTDLLAKTK